MGQMHIQSSFSPRTLQEGEPSSSKEIQSGRDLERYLSKKQALHWENIARLTST
nr:hypothetical protein [uncultured Solibaculum sp.]